MCHWKKQGLSLCLEEKMYKSGTYDQTRQWEDTKSHMVKSKGLRTQTKESPTGQIEENLGLKRTTARHWDQSNTLCPRAQNDSKVQTSSPVSYIKHYRANSLWTLGNKAKNQASIFLSPINCISGWQRNFSFKNWFICWVTTKWA